MQSPVRDPESMEAVMAFHFPSPDYPHIPKSQSKSHKSGTLQHFQGETSPLRAIEVGPLWGRLLCPGHPTQLKPDDFAIPSPYQPPNPSEQAQEKTEPHCCDSAMNHWDAEKPTAYAAAPAAFFCWAV